MEDGEHELSRKEAAGLGRMDDGSHRGAPSVGRKGVNTVAQDVQVLMVDDSVASPQEALKCPE